VVNNQFPVAVAKISYAKIQGFSEPGRKVTLSAINALREFLQDLLDQHVARELPKFRNEI
jgi:hypothetical protein